MTIDSLAKSIGINIDELITTLQKLGLPTNKKTFLDIEMLELVITELGHKCTIQNTFDIEIDSYLKNPYKNDSQIIERAPTVAIMGHVDHGKTSLLDNIRQKNTTEHESGGITQHISAYSVTHKEKKITFIDTPGHAIFSNIRSRSADIADIIILIVAADDGLKPQTIESIKFIKSAKIPFIVAINKIDKPHPNLEKLKSDLASQEIYLSDYGGNVPYVAISALHGTNVNELLDQINNLAEENNITGVENPEYSFGSVLEVKTKKSMGHSISCIVKHGQLKVGDFVAVGFNSGKIRNLIDDKNDSVKTIHLGMPCEIIGINAQEVRPGDRIIVFPNEKDSRLYINEKKSHIQNNAMHEEKEESKTNFDDLLSTFIKKDLLLIIKADTHSSLEAILQDINKIENKEVQIKIISSGIGDINESEVNLLNLQLANDIKNVTNARIIGFHVGINSSAQKLADTNKIQVNLYDVIYYLFESIVDSMESMLSPLVTEELTGSGFIKALFNIHKQGIILGIGVKDGVAKNGSLARIFRNDQIIHESKILGMKRNQSDVNEIQAGNDGGFKLEKEPEKVELNDIVKFYNVKTEKQKLN